MAGSFHEWIWLVEMVDIICKHGKYFKAYDYKAINSYEGKNVEFERLNVNSMFDCNCLFFDHSVKLISLFTTIVMLEKGKLLKCYSEILTFAAQNLH